MGTLECRRELGIERLESKVDLPSRTYHPQMQTSDPKPGTGGVITYVLLEDTARMFESVEEARKADEENMERTGQEEQRIIGEVHKFIWFSDGQTPAQEQVDATPDPVHADKKKKKRKEVPTTEGGDEKKRADEAWVDMAYSQAMAQFVFLSDEYTAFCTRNVNCCEMPPKVAAWRLKAQKFMGPALDADLSMQTIDCLRFLVRRMQDHVDVKVAIDPTKAQIDAKRDSDEEAEEEEGGINTIERDGDSKV